MVKTALYRHYDTKNNLLYVGVALNAVSRLSSHAASPWIDKITRMDVSYFRNRSDALAAERKAIAAEKPKYNIVGNSSSSKYRSSSTVLVSVRLPKMLYEALNAAALEDDASRTDIITQFLELGLISRS